MSQHEQTRDDVFDSLTGHDETAIVQHFDATITYLFSTNPSMYVRALIFVVKRRGGLNDDDARNEALDMPMKDIVNFFAAEADQESGKDETPSEPQPPSSPTGAPELAVVATTTSA